MGRLEPNGGDGAGSREWGWGGQEGMEMCPLACARRPLQELLLLLAVLSTLFKKCVIYLAVSGFSCGIWTLKL